MIERSMVRAMCGVQLKEGKRSRDLMLMLGLNETIDQLVMQTLFVGMVEVWLRREDGHVLRMALYFEVEVEREAEEDMNEEG